MNLKPVFDYIEGKRGRLPNNYLCFDIETTGFSNHDYIVQIGHCLVMDGKVVDNQAIYLDWRQCKGGALTSDVWQRLKTVQTKMASLGKPYNITWHDLCHLGQPPLDVLREYRDWFEDLPNTAVVGVTHGGHSFDIRFLERVFQMVLGRPTKNFDKHWVIDTGVILKASMLGRDLFHHPDLPAWSDHVRGFSAAGLKYSLHEFAVPEFSLDKDPVVSADKAHDAAYDCYVNHLLYDRLLSLARE